MRAVCPLLLVPLLLTGCLGQKELLEEQSRALDSLYVVERGLLAELYALQDTLHYYDDIDSGLYYRKQRALEDRINKLDYLLTVRRDELCVEEVIDTLLVDDLFEPASATLTDAGQEHLARLAERLDADFADRRHIRVEGHSDSVPPGPRLQEQYPSNWELSASRATSVVRHLIEAHGMDPTRMEAVSFGDTRPVAPNTTAEGRRQNRRIRVLVSSF